jgi:predicted RNase H-like nuclease
LDAAEDAPEALFAAMSGAPLAHGKHSAAGVVERRRLLAGAGLVTPDDAMPGFGASGLGDVHDATAMAWTARRAARGEAISLPDPPEVFSDGIACAIWA